MSGEWKCLHGCAMSFVWARELSEHLRTVHGITGDGDKVFGAPSTPKRSMTAAELLDVAEVERLALRPGDMLVLKVPLRLSEAEFAELDSRFRAVLPGVKVLVLECGMDISVLRAQDEQPAAEPPAGGHP